MGAKSKTSEQYIVLAEEISTALDLKRAGASIRQIAAHLKCSVGKAHDLVKKGIDGIPAESREALVREIHERQLGIIMANWDRRKDPKHAAIIQQSDKLLMDLLGLKAPTQTEITGSLTTNMTNATPAEARRLMLEAFGPVTPEAELGSEGDTSSPKQRPSGE